VLAVGALDAFAHDRVGEQLVPFIRRSLKNDPADLGPVERELKNVELREILRWLTLSRPFVQVRKVVENQIGAQSFQHPGKIEDAFQLIGKKRVWDQVAKDMGMNTSELKRTVANAAERRNQIVHEGDRERSRLKKHQKRPISQDDTTGVLDLVENVGESLSKVK
jgi:hypothetical protein